MLLLPKQIEVGKTYKVRVPTDESPFFSEIKQLVVAKSPRKIVTIDLEYKRIIKKDKEKLLTLKVSDFISNKKAIVNKYEECMVIYDIKKNELIDPCQDICVFVSNKK